MHKYQIYDRKNCTLLQEGTLKEVNGQYVMPCIVPDSDNAVVFVNGKIMQMRPVKPEFVENDQIVEIYWTYGESYTRLSDKRKEGEKVIWKSKYYDDLNLHVITKEGNDGKLVKFVLETGGERKINLCKTVSENKVVFDKAFKW